MIIFDNGIYISFDIATFLYTFPQHLKKGFLILPKITSLVKVVGTEMRVIDEIHVAILKCVMVMRL